MLKNCRFFLSAAAAQEAGYRPCLRCRPEAAPNLDSLPEPSDTVSRAFALMTDCLLDDNCEELLAQQLGVSETELRRLFIQHLGVSPSRLAIHRRTLFANQLISQTRLPLYKIARATGYNGRRKLNQIFQRLFRRSPRALRRSTSLLDTHAQATLTLYLAYRPPYDWDSILIYLQRRAIPGIEVIANGTYQRTLELGATAGRIEVKHVPDMCSLAARIDFPRAEYLHAIVTRVTRLFDLGADIETIGTHLARNPFLAPLVSLRPGLRAPGAWDPFELAIRAILGQQITVAGARCLAGQLAVLCGRPISRASDFHPDLSRLFPTPRDLAAADLSSIGMPESRRRALKSLATTLVETPELLRPSGSLGETLSRLRAIPGIGEWTAQYIALRAFRETDAFPASDIDLVRRAAAIAGIQPTPVDLLKLSHSWRPWRAYAAQHLWAANPQRDLNLKLGELRP
jgi:AraC family transcriptional regulator of adaptative response / DNA-3-methyladenine glycosylase II